MSRDRRRCPALRRRGMLAPVLTLVALFLLPTSTPAVATPPSVTVDLSAGSGPAYPGAPAAASTANGSAGLSLAWTSPANVTTGGSPPARFDEGFAYDPSLGAILVFGGHNGTGTVFGDTWSLGAAWNWSNLSVSPTPSPRFAVAMAYDVTTASMVLFGGENPSGGFDGDTWAYGGGHWARAPSHDVPPARAYAVLAPTPNGSGLLLTGGIGAHGALNDTWLWENRSWTNLTGTVGPGPSARFASAGAELPSAGVVVLFGGNLTNVSAPNATVQEAGDTWVFNGTAWRNLSLPKPATPIARSGASMAYDALDGELLLYGGSSNALAKQLATVWAFNGSGWSIVAINGTSHPHLRFGAGFTTGGPSTDGTPVLFGGSSGTNSSWAGVWTLGSYFPLTVSAPSPSKPAVDAGAAVAINVTALGGMPPYTYRWSGLPLPCTNTSTASPTCRPATNGSIARYYRPAVAVTDARSVRVTSPTASVALNAPLHVERFAVSPTSIGLGEAITLNVTVAGGGNPVRYVFSGLPPGCVSENLSTYQCTVTGAGTFSINVTATDPFGENDSLVATVTVAPASSLGLLLLGGGLVAVGVVVLAAVVVRARRRASRSASPAVPGAAP